MVMDAEIGRIDRTDREFPRFVKDMHRMDPWLLLSWHRTDHRWVIRRRSPRTGALINVLRLEGPRGEYRDPGEWVLNKLRSIDSFRTNPMREDTKAWAAEVDRQMNEGVIAKGEADKEKAHQDALEQHWIPYLQHRTGEKIQECMNPDSKGNKTGQRPTLGSADWKSGGAA